MGTQFTVNRILWIILAALTLAAAGAGVLSPLALAELVKPSRYGLEFNPGEFWLYLVLTVLFLFFAVIYLATAKRSGTQG